MPHLTPIADGRLSDTRAIAEVLQGWNACMRIACDDCAVTTVREPHHDDRTSPPWIYRR